MEQLKLPIAVSIRVDDVGWFEGADWRSMGLPSHSGLPRRHDPRDVQALAEIGRGLGTKVLCNLVLGDWDVRNRLRGVPHETWDEAGWDAASVIAKNRAFFDETFAILEGSEFLEYGLHGLQHGYFVDGKLHDEKYAYPHTVKNERGRWVRLPRDFGEFERMISLFFEIYHDWGFRKPVRVWEAGNGCYGTPDSDYNLEFARILRRYGIGIWEWGGWPSDATVREDMIFINSSLGFVTWNAYDIDPSLLYNCFEAGPRPGFVPNICGHLTNFVRFQPEKNFEYVPDWIDYFKRITSPFGAMIARDNEQSASQAVYAHYAVTDRVDGGWRIDLSPVDAVRTELVEDEFFVAIRDRRVPTSCTGGRIFVHECKEDHTIYRIARDGSPVVTLGMR